MLVSEHESLSLPIVDTSQVGEARRTVVGLAESLGFDETRRGQVALIVTELGNNLVRHATGGELVIRAPGAATDAPHGEGVQLEILAIDRGPGMANIAAAMRDGYSTGGTPGTGLGAVQRLSDEFDFSSTAGVGTVFHSRLYAQAPRPAPSFSTAKREHFDIGAICLPKPDESVCGDAWWIATDAGSPGRTIVLMADGLGHGLGAADASRMAVRLLRQNPNYELTRLMETMHAAMRSGRGAAVAMLEMRSGSDQVQFVGVGNISGVILSPSAQPDAGSIRNLMSHNGTVGAEMRRVQQLTYTLGADSLLVMHSDGLSAQWQLAKYPGLRGRGAAVIAGVLYRDHRRIRDDATVLVLRRA